MSAIADPSIGMLTAAERWVHSDPSTAPRASTLTGAVFGPQRMRFPFNGGEFVVEIEGAPPMWVTPTVNALGRVLSLPHNWDSYGARPIDPASVGAAIELAFALMNDATPAPTVVPTSTGGVQLEWHTRGIDLEIEVRSPSRISACFEDQRTHSAWDAEQLHDFRRLRDALRELARR